VVLAAVGAGIVASMQFGKAPPALPDLRLDLGLGLVMAGWVTSIITVIAAGLGIASGGVVDVLGRRRTLVAGLLCLAAGSLAGSFAESGSGLLAARIVEGVGFVVIVIAGPTLIAAAANRRQQRLAIGMWGTYMGTGMVIVMVLAPALLETLGWRGLWRVNSALTFAFAIVIVFITWGAVLPSDPGPMGRVSLAGLGRTLGRPGPWLLAACFFTYTLQWMGVIAWLPTFLIEEQGRPVLESTLLAALVIAVNVPGNLTGAWLLHRGVPRWLTIAFASGIMGLLAAGALASDAPDGLKYVMCLGFSYLGGILPASVLAGAPVHAAGPAFIGLTNGVLVQGANIGSLMGPPMVAALVSAGGDWRAPSWLLLAAGMLGILLATGLRAAERRL
jgi:MFS family permease